MMIKINIKYWCGVAIEHLVGAFMVIIIINTT